MPPDPPGPFEIIDALRVGFAARAAGLWRASGDRLEQAAFSAAPEMPEEVARAFAEATRSVPLDRTDLGIVRAFISGEVAVSDASELPEGHGSGLWLRKFGASRSVAVPFASGVISVALGDPPPTVEEIARKLREAVARTDA